MLIGPGAWHVHLEEDEVKDGQAPATAIRIVWQRGATGGTCRQKPDGGAKVPGR